MDWFLYDNDSRHERFKVEEYWLKMVYLYMQRCAVFFLISHFRSTRQNKTADCAGVKLYYTV